MNIPQLPTGAAHDRFRSPQIATAVEQVLSGRHS
jgi:hypothetical protein